MRLLGGTPHMILRTWKVSRVELLIITPIMTWRHSACPDSWRHSPASPLLPPSSIRPARTCIVCSAPVCARVSSHQLLCLMQPRHIVFISWSWSAAVIPCSKNTTQFAGPQFWIFLVCPMVVIKNIVCIILQCHWSHISISFLRFE